MMHLLAGLAAVALLAAHFGIPLLYHMYLRRFRDQPWGLSMRDDYLPVVAVIVPTYNEAGAIVRRLDNIYTQDYPRSRIRLIIVDSASSDGTAELAERWIRGHRDIWARLIVEPERRGKHSAVKHALSLLPGDAEIVVLTDADAVWERDALRRAVRYFSDPAVGAVTASIYYEDAEESIEQEYRRLYNEVRVSESKLCSTPIHNGPFLALRRSLIDKYGLPDYPGSDDSAYGSYIAFTGHRAIQVDDAVAYEPLERNQYRRKVRRAATLILALLKTKRYAVEKGVYRPSCFDRVWRIEWYLNIPNPLLLPIGVVLLAVAATVHPWAQLLLAAGALAAMVSKKGRLWLYNQVALLHAMIRLLYWRPEKW